MLAKIAGLIAVTSKEDVLGVAQKVCVVCDMTTRMDVTVLLVDTQGIYVLRSPTVFQYISVLGDINLVHVLRYF